MVCPILWILVFSKTQIMDRGFTCRCSMQLVIACVSVRILVRIKFGWFIHWLRWLSDSSAPDNCSQRHYLALRIVDWMSTRPFPQYKKHIVIKLEISLSFGGAATRRDAKFTNVNQSRRMTLRWCPPCSHRYNSNKKHRTLTAAFPNLQTTQTQRL